MSVIIYVVIIALALFWLWNLFGLGETILSDSQLYELFVQEKVQKFEVSDGKIYLTLQNMPDGQLEAVASMTDVESFRSEMGQLIRQQHEAGILLAYDWGQTETITPMDYVLPAFIVGIILLLIWFILMMTIMNKTYERF